MSTWISRKLNVTHKIHILISKLILKNYKQEMNESPGPAANTHCPALVPWDMWKQSRVESNHGGLRGHSARSILCALYLSIIIDYWNKGWVGAAEWLRATVFALPLTIRQIPPSTLPSLPIPLQSID